VPELFESLNTFFVWLLDFGLWQVAWRGGDMESAIVLILERMLRMDLLWRIQIMPERKTNKSKS
jgi:hypothetical protein